ncbi:MAG: amino acid ABC transporter permease [Chloroflexota bacterium]
MTDEPKSSTHASVPPWRDVRVLSIAFQVIVLVAVLVVGGFLLNNALTAMERQGFFPSLDFLGSTARFDIANPLIPYEASDTIGKALLVGLLSTLMVSFVAVILATVIGLFVGIARLSGNWLISRLALGFVELFRNTPLLLQLIVIYFGILQLPGPKEAIALPGSIFISKSGLDMPLAQLTGTGGLWLLSVVVAVAAVVALWIVAGRRERAGRRTRGLRTLAVVLLFAAPLLAWLVFAQPPVSFQIPELGRFNFSGGIAISAEFAALTLGLALYTAAFIAEIVRGGIESVTTGQVEAARAIGLREGQTLRLVVLPQALRVIIPPLTSQYLNLIKNSSLALVIGFQDVFGISATISTNTGQPVSVLVVVMAFYLAISLIVSALMNIYNRRVQITER